MSRDPMIRLVLFAMSLALLAGCGGGGEADAPGAVAMTPEERDAWEIRLVEMRIDKNERFMDPAQTPLAEADRPGFEGLNYYWPAPQFRFVVPFEAAEARETIGLVKRRGETVEYVRKGSVTFTHDGGPYSLDVFGPADVTEHGDYLWLPFYDDTSGETTYGGGRYLDLELAADGTVEVDFNWAYNPLCDYDHEGFNCTLPPDGNRLPFVVEAGEKLFRLEE